jgi:excisionase family DNA binding protein
VKIELMTPVEVAAYLGVSVKTLAVWRCTKRYPLPYVKVGRLVKYRKSDLDQFLKVRTVTRVEL